jgi:cold shock protein
LLGGQSWHGGALLLGRTSETLQKGLTDVQLGRLKFWNQDRGFGFIKPDDGDSDVFLHISALKRSGIDDIAEGARLSFEVEADERTGMPSATNIAVV